MSDKKPRTRTKTTDQDNPVEDKKTLVENAPDVAVNPSIVDEKVQTVSDEYSEKESTAYKPVLKVIGDTPELKLEYKSDNDYFIELKADLKSRGKFRRLSPGERTLIPISLSILVPQLFELEISGIQELALNKGIVMMSCPYVLGPGLHSEIKILVMNQSKHEVMITNGEPIAHMRIRQSSMILEIQDES